jgi:hypothetical protein
MPEIEPDHTAVMQEIVDWRNDQISMTAITREPAP